MRSRLNIAIVIHEWELKYQVDLKDWDNVLLGKFYDEYGEVLGVSRKQQAIMLMLNGVSKSAKLDHQAALLNW